ncbi:hypothetical protein AB0F52_47615 [Amycolatopsis sp. NPDC024027]|uniref:hypothetical protein n=1 Tax=Amycolatopsis sp. NPDC024027 TaxID=3154327 RepID=UPI0033F2DF7F
MTKLGATGPEAVRDHLLEHFVPAAIAAHMAAAEHPEQRYSKQQVHQRLRVLARYLDHNAKTGRTLGGVPLSGTDLVLHQLWPLAGVNRVRITVLAALALIWLIAAPVLLAHFGIGFSGRQLFGASGPALAVALVAYLSWSDLWPSPTHFTANMLRTRRGRRQLARPLGLGLVLGPGLGVAVGLVNEREIGLALANGLMAGIAAAIAVGARENDAATPMDPREIVSSISRGGSGSGSLPVS